MYNVITTEKLPIKMWLQEVEPSCMAQIKNLANLPFTFKQVAIMPDSHTGYGMPIGGVLATQGVVIPNAVGVDIGCGMCAVQTSIRTDDFTTEQLKTIMGKIRQRVPVGFGHHNNKQDEFLMPKGDGADWVFDSYKYPVVMKEYQSALHQIGTLGGGNHFIEIQKGDNGYIWIMIHSGSRNLGYKVARYYNDLAKELNAQWHTSVPKEFDLAFFPINTNEYNSYLLEMEYCLDFAKANRTLMIERIKEIFIEEIKDCTFIAMINIHHNYAKIEHHFGHNVMIHRKGATSAYEGQWGIIPGSQGTKSYIVQGLGNIESFMSCSHGAGRTMGRKEAQRKLNLEEEQKKLDDKGIIHAVRTINDLDEASGAYKDIDIVMANQSDLVKIVIELQPLGVIKG